MIKNVNTQRLVEEFVSLTKIASPSRQEKKFAAYMKDQLSALGFTIETDRAGEAIYGNVGNIIATLPGTKNGEPLMFCCHMDTVMPCENIRPIVDDDVIHTDGTTILSGDDKGGIAAILEAVRQIREQGMPYGPIQVVLTIGEEIGMYGSKNLDYSKIKAHKAIILDADGPLGNIVVRGPAKDVIEVAVKGRTAHAGMYPEQGISAIQVAAHAIDQMKLLRIDSDTTANLGTITGGTATNIVAEQVHIVAEARSLSNEKLAAQSLHMQACFENAAQVFGASAEVQIQRSYDAFHLAADIPIVAQCIAAMRSLELEPKLVSTGGGSDCNVFNARGIIAVDIAIGMTKVHTCEESIKISDLEMAVQLVIEIIKNN
jgi:tripeptide aminopeptidase